MIKFGESFSLGSLLNQSHTYQDNPCGVYPDLSSFIGSGVYPDLSSFTGSGIIQIFVVCIKWSAPSQVHIISSPQLDHRSTTHLWSIYRSENAWEESWVWGSSSFPLHLVGTISVISCSMEPKLEASGIMGRSAPLTSSNWLKTVQKFQELNGQCIIR